MTTPPRNTPRSASSMSLASTTPETRSRASPLTAGFATIGDGLDPEDELALSFNRSAFQESSQMLRDIIQSRGGTPHTVPRQVRPEVMPPRDPTPSAFLLVGSDNVDTQRLADLDATFDTVPPIESVIPQGSGSYQTPVRTIGSLMGNPTDEEADGTAGENTPAVDINSQNFDDVEEEDDGVVDGGATLPQTQQAEENAAAETEHVTPGEMGAAAEEEDVTVIVLPEGYPPIEEAFPADPVKAAHLFSSGLLPHLVSVRAETVKGCGSRTIQLSVSHSVTLTAYDQMIFAVACKYYSTLPVVDFCVETHQLLHNTNFYLRSQGEEGLTPNDRMRECYTEVSAEGLDHIAVVLCKLLLPESTLRTRNYLDSISVSNCKNIINVLRTACPSAMVLYRVFHQLFHGGMECIAPIPELLRFDDNLCAYINHIARGSAMMPASDIILRPREARLPIHLPDTGSTVRINPPPALGSADVSTTVPLPTGVGYGDAIQAQPTQPMPTAPPVMSTVMTPAASPAQQGAGPSSGPAFTTAYVPPMSAPQRTVPLPAAPMARPARQGYVNNPNQLMGQAAPRGAQVVRDTTGFRDSVDNYDDVRATLQLINQAIATLMTDNISIKETLQEICRRQGAMEAAFASAQVTRASRDLGDRYNLNRTIAVPQDSVAAQNVQAATAVRHPELNETQAFANKLRMANCMDLYPAIADEIKAYLLEHGHPGLANQSKTTSLRCPQFRGRLATRLESL